jgi:hypothetical protein
MKMAIDQVRIRSLYAGLHRIIVRFGLLIAAAWLFAVFSYYLSEKTGTDWFHAVRCAHGFERSAIP